MKKAIEKMVKNRSSRRKPDESDFCERSWPVEVYFGSDYSYCAADECKE